MRVRGGACRHPPGFQDDDPSVPQPILVEQAQRDHRRLAGTGFGRQHRRASTQGRPQLRDDVLHRQSGGGKSLARAGHPTHATGPWRASIWQLIVTALRAGEEATLPRKSANRD